MSDRNLAVVLQSRPSGWVDEGNFAIAENPPPQIGDGEMLLKTLFLSVDPYMRGRMNDIKSYVPPFQIGEPMEGGGVARVVQSNHPDFAAGDLVSGMMKFAEFSAHNGERLVKVADIGLPLSYYIGVLGMPGLTAYVGLLDIGQPQDGETVFVSAASGAVGSVVGQIAKIKGCRVAGSAGTDDKVAFVRDELGFDAAFNYRTAGDLDEAMRVACPKGIDVNFENVGGDQMDAVLKRMNQNGRIVLCGMIAHYNDADPRPGPRFLMNMIRQRVRMQGFIVSDYPDRIPQFINDMGGWLREGRIKYRESVSDGIESLPQAFIGMLKGENFGKQIIRVAEND